MSNNNKLKIGIIGCGWVTEYINEIIKKIENVEITAASDPLLERACKVAKEEHSYNDAENMYKKEDIDAVYIATPHHLHEPLIKQALEYNKHVLCEKPVSTSIEGARNILNLTKKYSNLKVGFMYQYRYDYNCYNLAIAAQSGYLGKIYYANSYGNFSRNLDYFNSGLWRGKKETSGGGTLLTQASHIIDIMIWCLGEVDSVIGKVDNLKFKHIDVEDIGFGIIEFQNGSYGLISNSMITKPYKKRITDRLELNVFGENGNCYYEGPWPLSTLKWDGIKKFEEKEYIQNKSPEGECVKAFVNWIINDKSFFNTVEESSKVLCLIQALYKSSESEKKEKVEKL